MSEVVFRPVRRWWVWAMANTFLSRLTAPVPFTTPGAEADMSLASPGSRRLTVPGWIPGQIPGQIPPRR